MKAIKSIPKLVQDLYSVVDQLENLFPGRKFTLDGHLVGSIGEVLAAHMYLLELLTASAERHDAIASDGRKVQIKATQSKSVSLRSEPEHLVVLKLHADGRANEIYNGPGALAWKYSGKMQKNGQRSIGVSKLQSVMQRVPTTERLPAVASDIW